MQVRREQHMKGEGREDKIKIWRTVSFVRDHPGNGQGVGGCITSTVFALLNCGHSRSYPKSKSPNIGSLARCRDCEMLTALAAVGKEGKT